MQHNYTTRIKNRTQQKMWITFVIHIFIYSTPLCSPLSGGRSSPPLTKGGWEGLEGIVAGAEIFAEIKSFNLCISSALAARSLDGTDSFILFLRVSSETGAGAGIGAGAGSLTTAFCGVPPSAVIFFKTSLNAILFFSTFLIGTLSKTFLIVLNYPGLLAGTKGLFA